MRTEGSEQDIEENPIHEDGFLDVDLGDCDLSPQYSRMYVRSSTPYIANQGIKRYHQALRTLIPVRKKDQQKDDIGVDQAGLCSFILSSWVSKLMYKANRKGLILDDIPRGSPYDSCNYNAQRLEMLWQEEMGNNGPSGASLSRAVWRFVRTRVIADWLTYLASLILGFITPMIFMRKLLEFAEDPEADLFQGFILAFALMFCELLRILLFSWKWVLSFRTANRLRVACQGLIYRKIMRLNRFEEKSLGQLINIFANDSQRIFDLVLLGPMIVGGPLVMIAGITYVVLTLGWWGLTGVMVFVAFYPIQYLISYGVSSLRAKAVQVSDQRVSLMNEILTFIKSIKMNVWEDGFEKQVVCARTNEQNYIKKTSYLSSIGSSLAPTMPIISCIVTFLTHIGAGNTLTAAQAFSTQAVFMNSVRNMVRALQFSLLAIYEGRIGLTRVQKCLLVEETHTRIQRPIDRSQAVSIGSATFNWGAVWCPTNDKADKKNKLKNPLEKVKKSDVEAGLEESEKLNKNDCGLQPILKGINFSASKGHLVGVCGRVGSGKTSLLLAALGQMHLVRGQLARDGSCAYVSQQAWITNGTLRDNILFGEAFESTRYYTVINSCALNEDLNQLPGGDLTEIGERGINLSGGQKQRVALARALYANRDIYLLDDPLSAVDVNVGAHIFEQYIQKELHNKTVVLVTHQIHYLSHCDEIYVMKEGTVIERGSHEELLKLDQEYSSMVKQGNGTASSLNSSTEEPSSASSHQNGTAEQHKADPKRIDKKAVPKTHEGESLTVAEPSSTGSLKLDTYCQYISAAGGHFMVLFVFVVFLVNIGSTAFSSWWLATWIKAGSGNVTVEMNNVTVLSKNLADNPHYEFYQTVYASTLVLIILTCGLRSLVFTKATIRAATKLHYQLLQKVLYSPMLFFDSNPIGRMQNLFSRDIDEVDNRLPNTLESIISNFWILAFAVLFVCIVFPWFFIAITMLTIMYYFVSKIFRKGIRDLKRLENSTRSPVLSNLTETVQGLSTICAFNKEGDYIQRFFKQCDENATCNYLVQVSSRWLAIRVELLAAISTTVTAFLVVILHGAVGPAMAGLALTYAWQISGMLQFTTRLISETEMRFLSVERILAYIDATVKEGKETSCRVPTSWPNEGRIKFQKVSMSYSQNMPNALKSISINILPGEKIGVVGRTGSGKSSLAVALFRLVELNSGCIKLDGLDIAEVSLSVLRSKIAIIPQDPVLFSGTLRSNLDYRNKVDDKSLMDALTKAKLLDRVNSLPQKLDTVIGDGSCGLSVGECQLLCLARALLTNSKVLILDEATASIDPETEAAVQSTIQEEFKTCTVLTIAHRISTVVNCDRILVMEEGKVAEFDEPNKLLENSDSAFSKLMATAE